MRPAHVVGLGLWAPGFPDVASWARGLIPSPSPSVAEKGVSVEPTSPLPAKDGEGPGVRCREREGTTDTPACEVLPPRERRALSLTTRMGVEVIGQAVASAGVDRSRVKLVFASAYGELQTAFDQMEMMASADGRLSPARFKNSVHNTATGLLSIAFGNQGFCTALAAGESSFAAAVLEGLVLLDQDGGEAVVAVADDVPAEPFRGPGRPGFAPLGLALCLAAEPSAGGAPPMARIEGFPSPSPPGTHAQGLAAGFADVPADFVGNPAAAGLPLLAAVLCGRSGWVPLAPGGGVDALGVEVVAGRGWRP